MTFSVARMDAEQASAWISLVSLAQLLPAALDQQLTEDAGIINFEYGLLGVLSQASERTLRIGDLVSALGVPYPRVSKAVSRLERRGLVERVEGTGDRRVSRVRLTREGRRIWLRATPRHIALARDQILGALDREELVELAALVGRINARLDPDSALGRLPEPAADD